jgi:hypothetical protein
MEEDKFMLKEQLTQTNQPIIEESDEKMRRLLQQQTPS